MCTYILHEFSATRTFTCLKLVEAENHCMYQYIGEQNELELMCNLGSRNSLFLENSANHPAEHL